MADTTYSTELLCSTDSISWPSGGWEAHAHRQDPPEEQSVAKRNASLEVTVLLGHLRVVDCVYSVVMDTLSWSKGSFEGLCLLKRLGTASVHPTRRSTNNTRMSSMLFLRGDLPIKLGWLPYSQTPPACWVLNIRARTLETPGHEIQTGRRAWGEGGYWQERGKEKQR